MRSASVAFLAAFALVAGCSSDNLYDPQKFFPGHDATGWNDCQSKFGPPPGTAVQICASLYYPPGSSVATAYEMAYFLPENAHVLLAVYDEHALWVKTLLDQDVQANPDNQTFYPIAWDFTDAAGRRVKSGDYRLYFRVGDYITSSDVAVP